MIDRSAAVRTQSALPAPADLADLKATLRGGLIQTGIAAALLLSGVVLARSGNLLAYAGSQLILAFFFVHAFVLLHEAGHDTLFPWRLANRLVGHAAGFLTLLPFWSWQRIHARHHHYAGWQDLDATTASLVPRTIRSWERRVINFVWATWIPLFAILYRIQNFWNLPRVSRYVSNPKNMTRIRINAIALLISYAAVIWLAGPVELLRLIGPAFLLSLVLQEFIILSQHTHVPQRVSGGSDVRPFSPQEQEAFTRSLTLPRWLSAALMHVDAHELHHMYPYVPGYRLRSIDYQPDNEVHWWTWLKAARGMKGTDFLFRNWNDTGVRI